MTGFIHDVAPGQKEAEYMPEIQKDAANSEEPEVCVSGSAGILHDRNGQAKLQQRSFLLMLTLISLLFLFLLKPFFGAVFWACVIGILFHPLHLRLLRTWQRPNLAALATLMICLLIGIVPALFVLGSFFQEGTQIYQRLQAGELNPAAFLDGIKQGVPAVTALMERFGLDLSTVQEQLSEMAITLSRHVAENAVQLGRGTLRFFINLGLMLYMVFFMLRDGASLVDLLIRALPLGDDCERLLLAKFAEVTRATVKGNLVVATIQGSLGGLIFWLLGLPGPLLWGVIMTLLSLIPVVGAGLIWGPVAIYLMAVGKWVPGLILAAFGAGVIGLVDNILRPILVGRDTKLPDYMVLLSTLGGIVLFGMNGFVVGPLIAALFVAFWEIFIREFNPPMPVPTEGGGNGEEKES
jgi:predicted PurR-regulated permease PerM